jgi:transposase
LSDAQWARVAPLLPGKPGDPGRSGTDNRLFLEAVLWMARAGAPWRDLPDMFGSWNTAPRRELLLRSEAISPAHIPLRQDRSKSFSAMIHLAAAFMALK